MTTAVTWVMANETSACRYILLDHVLVAVDGPAETAVAHGFDSTDLAREAAVMHTKSDEVVGWHMRGPMVAITTYVDPEKVVYVYRAERPLEAGLRLIMRRVDKGHGTVLT